MGECEMGVHVPDNERFRKNILFLTLERFSGMICQNIPPFGIFFQY
jgi:hypothetical protein